MHACEPQEREAARVDEEEDCRYTPSFLSADPAALAFFQEHGFVVYRAVVSPDKCRAARREIWDSLEEQTPELSRQDERSWASAKLSRFGMPKDGGVVWRAGMLQLRQDPEVHRCFSQVLGEEDILCSHDRWLLYRKTRAVQDPGSGLPRDMPGWRTERNLHLDLNPWEFASDEPEVYRRLAELDYGSGPRAFVKENNDIACGMGLCVQGILNLKDNYDLDQGCGGGTIVVPGFHRQFETWAETSLDESQRVEGSMQYKIPQNSALHQQAVRVTMREGSLLIWDQRVVHGSTPNTSTRNRIGVPIRFFRARVMHPARAENRAAACWRNLVAAGFGEQVSEVGMVAFGLQQHTEAVQMQARLAARRLRHPPTNLSNCVGSTEALAASAESGCAEAEQREAGSSGQQMVVLVGLPGSGKSTAARRLLEMGGPRWLRVNQDDLGSRAACEREASRALGRGMSVIVDRCNFDRQQRAHWVKLARQAPGRCQLTAVCLDVSPAECCERVANRSGHPTLSGARKHTDRVVHRMAAGLRPLEPDEGFDRVIRVGLQAELEEELSALAAMTSGQPSEGANAEAATESACTIDAPEQGPGSFAVAFEEAYASALTKFDSVEAYFERGQLVPEVSAMIASEIEEDADFSPVLEAADVKLLPLVRRCVGRAYGGWKAQGNSAQAKVKQVKDNQYPWPSIEPYPDWVSGQLENYTWTAQNEPAQLASRRAALEHELLHRPLIAASIKFDGTCFGKLHTGQLVGRKQMLWPGCDEYQKTPVAAAAVCDVAAVQRELTHLLGVQLSAVCVWGELMCNPNFYGCKQRGLFGEWLCFGIVAAIGTDGYCVEEVAQRLTEHGFAYSFSGNGSSLRLLLCPALREMLVEVGGCRVADDLLCGVTHAEMVAQAAENLSEGMNEGLVVVFARPGGGASLRKWKNSAEGSSISLKHAVRMQRALDAVLQLDDALDDQIIEMVKTMIAVAKADTRPMKRGRMKADRV